MTYPKQKPDFPKKSTGSYQETRLCDCCKVKKPKFTGYLQVFNNGLNQRWLCLDCKEKIE